MRSGGSSELGAHSRWDWAGGPEAPPLPAAAPAAPSLPPPLPRPHPKTPARLPAPLSPELGRLSAGGEGLGEAPQPWAPKPGEPGPQRQNQAWKREGQSRDPTQPLGGCASQRLLPRRASVPGVLPSDAFPTPPNAHTPTVPPDGFYYLQAKDALKSPLNHTTLQAGQNLPPAHVQLAGMQHMVGKPSEASFPPGEAH